MDRRRRTFWYLRLTLVAFVFGGIVWLGRKLPAPFAARRTNEVRFMESLVEIRDTRGDVLEVATRTDTAIFSERDSVDFSVFGLAIPGGETVVAVTLPVVYRFHILLSGAWQFRETEEVVEVVAPPPKPSLPPAPDISAMEVRTSQGLLRFNADEVEARVRAGISGQLALNAWRLAQSTPVRDAARRSVDGSLRQWLGWLPAESRAKHFVVVFADEIRPEAAPLRVTPR